MPTPDEQRILNEINNRETERAGWAAFILGFLSASLLFLLIFIPIAQTEAISEFILSGEASDYCSLNL